MGWRSDRYFQETQVRSRSDDTGLQVECEVPLLVENQTKQDPARMQDVGLVKMVKEAGPNQVKKL